MGFTGRFPLRFSIPSSFLIWGRFWILYTVPVFAGLILTQCTPNSSNGSGSADGTGLRAESCYPCHGDDYKTEIAGMHYPDDLATLTVPLNYASYRSIIYSPRTDAGILFNGDLNSLPGYSNKRSEFDPNTFDVDTDPMKTVDRARFGFTFGSHTQQINNPSFHPVSGRGRNGSWQLCNQLAGPYQLDCGCGVGATCPVDNFDAAQSSQVLSQITVPCWGCHESRNFSLRSSSAFGPPHQMDQARLLIAPYDTGALMPGRCFEEGDPPGCAKGDGFDPDPPYGSDDGFYGKFVLCFQCHDRRAFDPDLADVNDRRWTRFFGVSVTLAQPTKADGNLHMYHLHWGGALCSECHYNIHSNVEAINTIYGDGHGGMLADDGEDGFADGVKGTHLIDFGPTVEGTGNPKPLWFYDGRSFKCYLRCHNEVMDSCAYLDPVTGSPNSRNCAGGQNPGRSG